MKFNYKCKGSASEGWDIGVFEADTEKLAQTKLDEVYGVKRDEEGKQINSDMIRVIIIPETEFEKIQAEISKKIAKTESTIEELTHTIVE